MTSCARTAKVLKEAVRALSLPPLDALRVLGNATLFSRSSNSLQDNGLVGGGGRWGAGGRKRGEIGEDRELLRFLRALYANSSARTNEVYGTRLPTPKFVAADLASHKRLCAKYAAT